MSKETTFYFSIPTLLGLIRIIHSLQTNKITAKKYLALSPISPKRRPEDPGYRRSAWIKRDNINSLNLA